MNVTNIRINLSNKICKLIDGKNKIKNKKVTKMWILKCWEKKEKTKEKEKKRKKEDVSSMFLINNMQLIYSPSYYTYQIIYFV